MRVVVLLACLLTVACQPGIDQIRQPDMTRVAPAAVARQATKPIVVVRGTESLEYEVTAPSMAIAQTYKLLAYVGGATVPIEVPHVCGTGPTAGQFTCAGPIAALNLTGVQSIDIALREQTVGGALDSPKTIGPFDLRRASLPAGPLNLRVRP